jgi:hypothetical protein
MKIEPGVLDFVLPRLPQAVQIISPLDICCSPPGDPA